MIVETQGEAGTHRANAAGGSVTRNCDYFLVNGDLVDVVSRPTVVDGFPSAPHKLVHWVFRAEKKERRCLCSTFQTNYFDKVKVKPSLSLSLLATTPYVENIEMFKQL